MIGHLYGCSFCISNASFQNFMSMIPKNHAHVLYAIMLMIFEIMSMILKLLALGILRTTFSCSTNPRQDGTWLRPKRP